MRLEHHLWQVTVTQYSLKKHILQATFQFKGKKWVLIVDFVRTFEVYGFFGNESRVFYRVKVSKVQDVWP